ncbi:hypothetical protein GCM10027578_03100 [Spirosoma luteolum]
MTRTLSLARRRVAVLIQLGSCPLLYVLTQTAGLPAQLAGALGLLLIMASSAYLYYKTGLWQFGNAPDEQVDERQVQVRNQAYRYAYMGLSLVVLLLAGYGLMALDLHWPLPSLAGSYDLVFWGTWVVVLGLPSALLAWTEPDVYGAVDPRDLIA